MKNFKEVITNAINIYNEIPNNFAKRRWEDYSGLNFYFNEYGHAIKVKLSGNFTYENDTINFEIDNLFGFEIIIEHSILIPKESYQLLQFNYFKNGNITFSNCLISGRFLIKTTIDFDYCHLLDVQGDINFEENGNVCISNCDDSLPRQKFLNALNQLPDMFLNNEQEKTLFFFNFEDKVKSQIETKIRIHKSKFRAFNAVGVPDCFVTESELDKAYFSDVQTVAFDSSPPKLNQVNILTVEKANTVSLLNIEFNTLKIFYCVENATMLRLEGLKGMNHNFNGSSIWLSHCRFREVFFTDCDVRNLDLLRINATDISDFSFEAFVWPDNGKDYYEGNYFAKKDFFGKLKSIYARSGDNYNAEKFYKAEQKYTYLLSKTYSWDRFILWFSEITSEYGTSIYKSLRSYLCFSIISTLSILLTNNLTFKTIGPLLFSTILFPIVKIPDKILHAVSPSWILIIYVLKSFNSFFIYQLLLSFRKFSRKY